MNDDKKKKRMVAAVAAIVLVVIAGGTAWNAYSGQMAKIENEMKYVAYRERIDYFGKALASENDMVFAKMSMGASGNDAYNDGCELGRRLGRAAKQLQEARDLYEKDCAAK